MVQTAGALVLLVLALLAALVTAWFWVPIVLVVALAGFFLQRAQKSSVSTAADAADATRQQWDYIVVGGGTAGCLLANRLTSGKGAGKRVLVLEAGSGDYNHPMVKVPAGVLKLFQGDKDWNFTSVNETKTSGRGIYLCRGKVLGGSSALNVLLYTRGDQHDYDTWETEYGCVGWGGKDVLPLFKRHEDDLTGCAKDTKHHSTGGEYAVEHVRYQNPLSKLFLQACKQAGLPSNDDFNNWSRSQEGAGRFPVSSRSGTRCHAANAFLEPALSDPTRKLKVLTGALVRKIIFDGKAAAGVQFSADGVTQIVRLAPGGEVLLTGGALHSPQVLMLSGIGPKEQLEEHGIEVIKSLRGVGENLQDQPAAVVSFECPKEQRGISVTSKIRIPHTTLPHPLPVLQWLFQKTGPLCSTGCDHGGFFRTSAAVKDSPSPDLQMRFLAARAVTADGMGSFTKFKNITDHPDGFSFQSIAVRPKSRGRVTLASADPNVKPVVETRYLTQKEDFATIREGIRLGRKLAQQPAFKDYLGPEVFPGPHVHTDKELDAYISDSAHTANALVGTCRMGPTQDPLAVVDPDMCVMGTTGLRICDSSIMPQLPGGQGASCTLMIAERAAELVLRSCT
jgi:choline dehydrogenase-like flavoprotein